MERRTGAYTGRDRDKDKDRDRDRDRETDRYKCFHAGLEGFVDLVGRCKLNQKRETYIDRDTDGNRHTSRHTQADTHTQTHTRRHTHADTHTQTHTHTSLPGIA